VHENDEGPAIAGPSCVRGDASVIRLFLRLPLAGLADSLANGVSVQDSAGLLASVIRMGVRVSPHRAQAAAGDSEDLCGIDAGSLPHGLLLLPGVTEATFLTLRTSPVQDARDASQPVCGPCSPRSSRNPRVRSRFD
jgi:hypothetical protein